MGLTISQLDVGYGQQTILSHLTLPEIPAGSLIAVVGANAVGKSTLLKSMAGHLKAKGHLELDGSPILSMNQQQRIKKVGYLPQNLPQPTSLVAYELIHNACRMAGKSEAVNDQVETIFDRLGIRHLALKKMNTLSGGQRQMVGLAQVLVRQPQLLLLDEPTSALDLHWQLNVLEVVKQETRLAGTTAFIALHDLNLALRFCDQLLVLAKGKLLAFGSPETVFTPDCLQQAYAVEGRIERCSRGYPIVLVDRSTARVSAPEQ